MGGQQPNRGSGEARFALRLLVRLAEFFVAFLVAVFVLYFIQGVNSVMTYLPPIGGVMAFELNLAQLGAEVLAGVFGLGLLLHQLPRIRRRLDKAVGGQSED